MSETANEKGSVKLTEVKYREWAEVYIILHPVVDCSYLNCSFHQNHFEGIAEYECNQEYNYELILLNVLFPKVLYTGAYSIELVLKENGSEVFMKSGSILGFWMSFRRQDGAHIIKKRKTVL